MLNHQHKGTNHIFKIDFNFENYLSKLSYKYAISLCRFRLSNHKLPIEKDRYKDVNRYERYCTVCNTDKIGDEFHFLFECMALKDLRSKYLKRYYCKKPNVIKLYQLLI